MALAISNVPVLTGDVAERFDREAQYNLEHRSGTNHTTRMLNAIVAVEENTKKMYQILAARKRQ